MVNRVTLIGNLGRDPEIRRLENGTAVGKFSVATNESYKDSSGEWQQQTEWHEVVVWRALAEQAEKALKKGALIFVEGKLSYRKYTDKNNIERTAVEIVANTFRLLERREGSGGGRESSFPTQETTHVKGGQNAPALEVMNSGEEPQNGDDLPF
jgi:single-strand DNA-binding protein